MVTADEFIAGFIQLVVGFALFVALIELWLGPKR